MSEAFLRLDQKGDDSLPPFPPNFSYEISGRVFLPYAFETVPGNRLSILTLMITLRLTIKCDPCGD